MLNFSSRNLKSFFLIFASSIALASIILIFIFVKNNSNQNKAISFIQNLEEISNNLKDLSDAVNNYKNAVHSNDFYIYKRDIYSDKVFFYINLLKNKIDTQNKNTSAVSFDISTKLNEIKDNSEDFETDFELLNENTVKIGNYENGYIENIIRTEQKTDKILKTYPQLYSQFQKLKKAKINILSTGNKKNKELFLKEKNNFLRNLNRNQSIFENTSEKQIVINNTADWINTILQYFKIKQINGTLYSPGLYNKLESFIYENNNKLSEIRKITLTELSGMNKNILINTVSLLILFAILFITIGFYIFNSVKKRITTINSKLSELTALKGDDDKNYSEFEKTNLLINELKNDTENKIKFIKSLESKNYTAAEIDFNSEDKTGTALISLKEFLKNEDIRRKKEEEIKAISDKQKDGIVKFGKIIRQHFGNIDDLTFDLLSELVHFLNADIGGFYIIDKKTKPDILQLKASYAYDKKKIINKEIKIGEGLAGTCAADKSSVYINHVDDDYIKIVSGFGHTKPKSILLSPIYVENDVYGVIELASSREFTENDIKFIEMLSEDIAYTLSYLLKQN